MPLHIRSPAPATVRRLESEFTRTVEAALGTTEAAILHQLTNLEQSVTSRCRILSAAFAWKYLQALVKQQRSLENYALTSRQLQENVNQLQAEQTKSARHLQRLSDIHANLEPLLSRLGAVLSAR